MNEQNQRLVDLKILEIIKNAQTTEENPETEQTGQDVAEQIFDQLYQNIVNSLE
jgi:hypothetical protein